MRWATVFVLCMAMGQIHAQDFAPEMKGESTAAVPVLQRVGFDQRLGAQVPLDLVFRDEHGRAVALREYFGKRPVVLSLAYYQCPMLCTLALNGQLRLYRATTFDIGKDFEVVTVSIDPRETPALAAAKKQAYITKYGRAGGAQGWHFLTGNEPSIKALADAVGFRYYYDKEKDQYAHATGLLITTPGGKISGYQFGVEYSARDLRMSLVQASAGKIGTPIDQVLLFCFHYDPATGKYSAVIVHILQLAAALTLLTLGSFLYVMFRRDKRVKAPPPEVRS